MSDIEESETRISCATDKQPTMQALTMMRHWMFCARISTMKENANVMALVGLNNSGSEHLFWDFLTSSGRDIV